MPNNWKRQREQQNRQGGASGESVLGRFGMGRRLLFHLDGKANSLEWDRSPVRPAVFTYLRDSLCSPEACCKACRSRHFHWLLVSLRSVPPQTRQRKGVLSSLFYETLGLSHSHAGCCWSRVGNWTQYFCFSHQSSWFAYLHTAVTVASALPSCLLLVFSHPPPKQLAFATLLTLEWMSY